MLLSILKKAKQNGAPVAYVKGRYVEQDERIKKNNKLIVFEQSIGDLHDYTPAVFETTVAYGNQPKIYHMRNVEVLVIEGYAIFFHIEEPIAIIYKLNSSRDNILMDYQLTAASIFGLDGEKSIAKQDREGFFVSNNEEWEDFLTAMTASGYIDTESTAALQVTTVSAF